MCMQCVVDALVVIEDILPGYALMISTKDDPRWPKGSFGLVYCNDPDFVWAGEPPRDPFYGMSDVQIEAVPEDDELWDQFRKFAKFITEVRDQFDEDPIVGYRFVKDSIC